MQCQRCSSRQQHAAEHLDNKQDHFLLSSLGRAVRRSVEQWSFPSCCDYHQGHMEAAAREEFPGRSISTNSEKVFHDKQDDDWVDEDEQEECLEGHHRRRIHLLQNGSKSRGYYEQLYYDRVKRSDRTVKPHEDSCPEIEDGVVEDGLRERIELLFTMPLAGDQGSDSEELLCIKEIEHDLKEGDLLLKTTGSDEYLVNNHMNMKEILDHDLDEMTPRGNPVVKQNPYVSFVRKSDRGLAEDFLRSYPVDERAKGLLEYTRGKETGEESPEPGEPEESTSCQEEKEKNTMIRSERPDDKSKSLDTISEFSDSESLLAGSEIGKGHGSDQVDTKPNEQEAASTDLQSQSSRKSADSKTESSGEIKKTPKFNSMKKTKIGTKKTKTGQNKQKRGTKKSVTKTNLDNGNIHKINSYLDNLKETTVLRLFQSHLQTKCSADLNSQLIFKFDDVIE